MKAYKVVDFWGDGTWHVRPTDHLYSTVGQIKGSFNVIPARLFALSYDQYLRMVKTNYNAELKLDIGFYATVYFKNKEDANVLCKELNARWDYIMSEQS